MNAETQELMALYEAAPPAKKKVLHLLIMLLGLYKSNRDKHGRFRKPPSSAAWMHELLSTIRGAHDFQGDEEQAAIDEFLSLLAGEIEREQQGGAA